ncbi:hypothetical protein HYW19_00485 [Candidatus Woesearchaeota archaeon]|nr:hypothetical protein [Candidatus Woesearchaeota archaeon]
MTSKEYVGSWILLTLSTSHKSLGVNPADMHYRKPPEIDVSLNDFLDCLNKLQSKNFVSQSSILGGHVCITKDGEKELQKKVDELKRQKQEKYISLISLSPIYELKERISTLEKFIFYSFMGGLLLYTFNIGQKGMNDLFKIVWAVITILFFIPAVNHFTTFILFAKRGVRERVLEGFWNFVDNNEKSIFYMMFIAILGGVSYILNKNFGFKWEIIIGTIILGILVDSIWNQKKFQNKFIKFKKRMKSKYPN